MNLRQIEGFLRGYNVEYVIPFMKGAGLNHLGTGGEGAFMIRKNKYGEREQYEMRAVSVKKTVLGADSITMGLLARTVDEVLDKLVEACDYGDMYTIGDPVHLVVYDGQHLFRHAAEDGYEFRLRCIYYHFPSGKVRGPRFNEDGEYGP